MAQSWPAVHPWRAGGEVNQPYGALQRRTALCLNGSDTPRRFCSLMTSPVHMCTHFPFVLTCVFVDMYSAVCWTCSLHKI